MKLLLALLITAITAWALPTALPGACNSVVVVPVPPSAGTQPSDPREHPPFHGSNRTISSGIIPTTIPTVDPATVPVIVPEPHTPKPTPADGGPSHARDDVYHLACTSFIVSRFCGTFSLCTPQAKLTSLVDGCNVFCSCEANGQTPDAAGGDIVDGKALDAVGGMPELPKIEKPRLPEGHPGQPELGHTRSGHLRPETHQSHEPIAIPDDIMVEEPRSHQPQPTGAETAEFRQHEISRQSQHSKTPSPTKTTQSIGISTLT